MGLEDWIQRNDDRPDLFEYDEADSFGFDFPCCVCEHRNRPQQECIGCCHCAK